MEFLYENYTWLFSGAGVAILGWIFLRRKDSSKESRTSSVVGNYINITNKSGVSIPSTIDNKFVPKVKRKEDFRILFIDDKYSEFKMVSILKKAGWTSTKAIKDLTDLDDHKVLEASMIFVDINGVGSQLFDDQGLGLAAALKDKYPNKTIVLYSADPTGDRFDKKLKKVDDSLPKNAEPYEFISLITSYSQISDQ